MKEVIENNVIFIKKTEERDLPYILTTESHHDNMPYIINWTLEEHEKAIRSDTNLLHLIVIEKKENKPVGYLLINGLNNPNQSIELKRTAFSAKGKGYGRNMLKLMKEWVFTEKGANRFWLDVVDHNTRAKTLYESEGFVVEGLQREAVIINEQFKSIYLMSMLKKDYLKTLE
ncbi:GNAT family N-acetyltransferase [Niallia nealsonii]|uniref:GNAT family N-acetyltransferase n=1 Tax=Niallia nealsonii TaxID=115979 RepID=A0A2N0Z7B5_9BACI|nr:GNAT family N-acetyltransferase [Niallia nealsonii]